MTNNEMLDYIINSERWGEPTCVEEATKNHEIEKWLRKQIEINEILKKRISIRDDQLTDREYIAIYIYEQLDKEDFVKIKGWLNEI